MSSFNKQYDGFASNIITNAIVFPGVKLEKMTIETPRHFSKNALWDTGAQITVISDKVVKSLGLTPYGKGTVMGIGGEDDVDTYHIHVLLPNGFLVCDVEAYCSDIEDDILIGMDIISLTDFIITNKDCKTNFIMRAPSEGVNL